MTISDDILNSVIEDLKAQKPEEVLKLLKVIKGFVICPHCQLICNSSDIICSRCSYILGGYGE